VKPAFALTEENAPTVVEICARLDGLPLAIELAAARIRLFPPHTLLQRLSSRLTLLTGGARDAPARLQTLRSTIDWSHDLLSEGERQLFARLSVFAGGCTYQAVEAVTRRTPDVDGSLDLIEGLTSLLEKSLLRESSAEEAALAEPRFSMLETIREYASERLAASGEERQIRRAHAIFFTEMAERGQPKLWNLEQKEWQDLLERELDNIRAALDWSLQDGDPLLGMRLAAAIVLMLSDRGYLSEGRRRIDALLATGAGTGTPLRAKLVDAAGMLARYQGDLEVAQRRLEEGLSLYRALEDTHGIAMSLAHLGGLARLRGDLDAAVPLLEETLALTRQIGDRAYLSSALTNLGEVRMRQGEYDQALAMLDEALNLRREMGDRAAVGQTLVALARVEQARGDIAQAVSFSREAAALLAAVGSLPTLVTALEGLADLWVVQGRAQQSARIQGAAAALRETLGLPSAPDAAGAYASLWNASSLISEAEWIAAWNEGHALSPGEVTAYVLGQE
jgi:tetratricopeptide (TPR) repeat protein